MSLKPCNSVLRGYDMDEVEPELLGTCGTTVNTVGWKGPRGTTLGASGRVRFSDVHTITVKAPSPA